MSGRKLSELQRAHLRWNCIRLERVITEDSGRITWFSVEGGGGGQESLTQIKGGTIEN